MTRADSEYSVYKKRAIQKCFQWKLFTTLWHKQQGFRIPTDFWSFGVNRWFPAPFLFSDISIGFKRELKMGGKTPQLTSVSKKPGQTTVVIQYYSLSRFFWNRRYNRNSYGRFNFFTTDFFITGEKFIKRRKKENF